MNDEDTNRIKKVLHDNTQDSEYYKRQREKRLKYDARITEMKDIIE